MDRKREEQIRKRAYQIWEREGQPSGRDQEHWYRAQSEVGEDKHQPAVAPAEIAEAPAAAATAAKKSARGARSAAAATAPERPRRKK